MGRREYIISVKRVEYLIKDRKKWLGVLIGDRKLPKIEMHHLSWDKLKKKVRRVSWDGGSSFYDNTISFLTLSILLLLMFLLMIALPRISILLIIFNYFCYYFYLPCCLYHKSFWRLWYRKYHINIKSNLGPQHCKYGFATACSEILNLVESCIGLLQ